MAQDQLRANGPKKNHKKGYAAANKASKRKEAEERQAKYSKLTVQQKLDQPHLGKKERDKLLAKWSGVTK